MREGGRAAILGSDMVSKSLPAVDGARLQMGTMKIWLLNLKFEHRQGEHQTALELHSVHELIFQRNHVHCYAITNQRVVRRESFRFKHLLIKRHLKNQHDNFKLSHKQVATIQVRCGILV